MDNGVLTPCGYPESPEHLIDEIRLPSQTEPEEYERLTADIALLKPLIYRPNSLLISNRNYELSLNRNEIVAHSGIMLRDQDEVLKRGHIDSCSFTHRNLNLYNVMTVIDTNEATPTAITRDGDSGALVLQEMSLNAGYRDAKVYGMVTGVFKRGTGANRRSMTVVNRLADVLDHCGMFPPEARAEFSPG